MNYSRAWLPIYICGLVVFVVFAGAAVLFKERRVSLIAAAVGVLAVAWLAERVFWPTPKRSGVTRKEMLTVGLLPVSGSLYIGDIFESGRPPVVVEASAGVYEMNVERFCNGDDHYVSAIILALKSRSRLVATSRRVDSESGFIAIINRPPDDPLRAALAAARYRVLHDKSRRLDVELVRVATEIVGVVCASGLGNGQYQIVPGEDGFVLRFIEKLDEI
jgi:hypothetical protein